MELDQVRKKIPFYFILRKHVFYSPLPSKLSCSIQKIINSFSFVVYSSTTLWIDVKEKLEGLQHANALKGCKSVILFNRLATTAWK